jgi:translation initiation factor IF-3
VVEQFPKMEGRQMVMVLAPKKVEKVVAKPPKASKPAEKLADKIEVPATE